MRVLAIDTAGPVIGVALAVEDRVTLRTERVRRGAEARLVPWATELCAEAGISLTDLDGVAVAVGPGAFTGIRVGLATAVGLGVGLGRPLWGASSLMSRADRVEGSEPVLALLDARKGRVYAEAYRQGEPFAGPGDVDPEVALGWMEGPFYATGEGALVFGEQIRARGGIVVPEADHPAVDRLAIRGQRALSAGQGLDPAQVRPVYLRGADAVPRAGSRR